MKTDSDISLDRKEEGCNIGDVTKGRHPHSDVPSELPLSESHPKILSGLRGEGILGNKRVLPEFLIAQASDLELRVHPLITKILLIIMIIILIIVYFPK